MKKFYVIQNSGQIIEAKKYLDAQMGSEEFLRFIKLESEENVKPIIDKNKSNYLDVSKKFGFNWEANADVGLVNYDYKASIIMALVKAYAQQLVSQIGFPIYQVSGSNMFDLSYPVVEAYAGLYGDRLYKFKSGKKNVVMSYDASYSQFNLASQYSLSYRQLPFSHFSISDCYRHEQSGECMLLYRQRRFYMPDVHPYFRDVAEAFAWYPKIQRQIIEAAEAISCQYQIVIEVSSEINWGKYQSELIKIAVDLQQDILIAVDEDIKDRYWIINADYKIIDQFGQSREIACIQIDVGNAQRLGINYMDQNGQKKNPAIIHSAVPGGIERYIYMALDNFPKSFPLWLFPIQLRLIPVSQNHVAFCEKLVDQLKGLSIRIDIDDRAESVGKKIKMCHQDLVPMLAVIGDKEVGINDAKIILEQQLGEILKSGEGKPFVAQGFPALVSLQPR